MDGLDVRCDSANSHLLSLSLSSLPLGKIERKFLVPSSGTRKDEKSAIRCDVVKCHSACQVCLPALPNFNSPPLNEHRDTAGYCQPFLRCSSLLSFQPRYLSDFPSNLALGLPSKDLFVTPNRYVRSSPRCSFMLLIPILIAAQDSNRRSAYTPFLS